MSLKETACETAHCDTVANDRRLVIIQRNPTSGSGRGARQLLLLIRELKAAGFRVRLFANRDRLDAFLQRPEIQQDVRCLVAAGGDGTIGSLVNRHADYPITTLPLGTENLMARHLGVPQCGTTVARLIAGGKLRQFDTGSVNGQRFLLMVSVGIDAEVVRQLHQRRTGNIRHLSYLKPIFGSFTGYSFPVLSVYSEDGELLAEGSHVIATNIPEYGFRMAFAPDANPHDGRLHVRVFKKFGRIATILHAIRTRLGGKDRESEVQRFVADHIEVRSNVPETPVQCDGDPAVSCPVTIRSLPASMTLMVPDDDKVR